jgi:very-short-patch-repair endonuclease
MTIIFNKSSEKKKRRFLRNHSTKTEKLLWRYLRKSQVKGCKFRRQYSVGAFVIDFYCAELKLAIEVDGPTHLGKETKEYDEVRQKYIEAFEIQFLRFTNEEVLENLDKVIAIISKKIDELRETK